MRRKTEMEPKEETRLLVIGIGNEAMKDDGLGVHVVGELRKRQLPEGIELTVLGSDPLDFLLLDREADAIVFIDAVCSAGKAGSIHRLDVEEAFRPAIDRPPSSLHQLGLAETLRLARAMGRDIPAVVLGVECEAIRPGQELSAHLIEILPDVVDEMAEEIMKIYGTICTTPMKVC